MSDLPLVIANPAAGGGTGRERWWAASGPVADRLGRHDLVWTEAPGHAERIARAEGNSRPLLIAYGGDGTASEVARGLALSGGSAELGLLPSGTGNDFAGDAGVPTRLAEAARFLRNTLARPTDLGQVEDASGAKRYFLNSFSLGLAASVAERASSGAGLGKATYAAAAAREVARFRPVSLRVGMGENPRRPRTLLNLTVLNSRRFGGGIPLAPPADPGDGVLDAVLIGPLGPVALMDAIFRLTRETHFGRREIEHHRITHATVGSLPGTGSASELLSEIDGDVLRWRDSVSVSVVPGALRIRRTEPRRSGRDPGA
ncbi:MAG: diacylglycerol kinase family protein [Acidobacteria bacterium]|nr:diacylglycerol kinase family protein [Acidobacteriota bacterium]